jgi:mannose-1-phosphate guanylyltransferase
MFVWRADRVREEIARQLPELEAGLTSIAASVGRGAGPDEIAAVWSTLPTQTIDYGVMEHAGQASVIPADELGWCDIGSWDRLFEILPRDSSGNVVLGPGEPLMIDTHGTLVHGLEAGRLVVTLGVDELLVIDAGDVLLVCPRSRAEEIRNVVDRLASGGRVEFT